MIARFMLCFGWSGLLSALAWLGAAVVCVLCRRHGRRERFFALALGLAILGTLFAAWHSARVDDIRLDQSDEIRAAREAQQRDLEAQERARQKNEGEVAVRFAEDAPGETVAPVNPLPGKGVATADAAPEGEPAYRSGGRQKRVGGKVDKASEKLARAATSGPESEAPAAVSLRLPDYQLANVLSRANRILARLILLGVLGVLVIDYLRRFDWPAGGYGPLPLASVGLNRLEPGPLLIAWNTATEAQLQGYLESILRKGESFVYFGDRAGADRLRLQRLALGPWRFRPWRLLTWSDGVTPNDPEFILDSVWFGRYLVCVPTREAPSVLRAIAPLLAERLRLRARARGLPHLIWDAGPVADPALLGTMTQAASETGMRFVVLGQAATDLRPPRWTVLDGHPALPAP